MSPVWCLCWNFTECNLTSDIWWNFFKLTVVLLWSSVLDQQKMCVPPRVGNSLFGFLRELLIFCEQKRESAFCSFFEQIAKSLFCKGWLEQIADCHSFLMSDRSDSLMVALFKKIDVSELLSLLFKKEQLSKEEWERFALGHKKRKIVKNIWKIWVICLNYEQITDVTQNCSFWRAMRAIHSQLLFCHEQPEGFAHGHSFVKSDKSELLTMAL